MMLTAVDELTDKNIRFTNPVPVCRHELSVVYAALDSNPLLVQSPKMMVKKVVENQSISMTFSARDDKFHILLEHLDSMIRKDSLKHYKEYEIHKSQTDDGFRAKFPMGLKGVETKFFMSNKRDTEVNIESKNIAKTLQDACVRLICRLDGYSVDHSKKVIKPIWKIQQCLIANQSNNPIGRDYCFLDDEQDLHYFSE